MEHVPLRSEVTQHQEMWEELIEQAAEALRGQGAGCRSDRLQGQEQSCQRRLERPGFLCVRAAAGWVKRPSGFSGLLLFCVVLSPGRGVVLSGVCVGGCAARTGFGGLYRGCRAGPS